jgi:hypothetical protein
MNSRRATINVLTVTCTNRLIIRRFTERLSESVID